MAKKLLTKMQNHTKKSVSSWTKRSYKPYVTVTFISSFLYYKEQSLYVVLFLLQYESQEVEKR